MKYEFKIFLQEYGFINLYTLSFSENHQYSKTFKTVAILGSPFDYEPVDFPKRLYNILDWELRM